MRRLLPLLVLLAGCRSRSELVIGVATDLKARNEIDQVQLTATQDGRVVLTHDWTLADVPAGRFELPGSFGLYTDDGSEPRVEIDLYGSRNGEQLITRRSLLSLVHGDLLFMRMALVGDCVSSDGPSCGSDENCIEGVCRPLEMDPTRLPDYRDGMAQNLQCDSGTRFVVSSNGAAMPLVGNGCGTGQFCQEGTCYNYLPADSRSGQGLWVQEPTPVGTVLRALWGTPDGADVFAAGQQGTLLHLTNNGPMAASRWINESIDPTHHLYALWGTSATDVWAAGSGGVILHRDASGWHPTAAPPMERLSGLWGFGPNDVFAVGRAAQKTPGVLHWDGSTWTALPPPQAPGELRAAWGTRPDALWVVGPRMSISRWDGSTWTSLPAGSTVVDLFAVWGSADDDVYFAGRGGVVAHYTGTPAYTAEVVSEGDIFTGWAGAHDDVFAGGDYGLIYHFGTDGRWELSPSGTRFPLFGLWGNGPDAYAAGRAGTLLNLRMSNVPLADLSVPVDLSVAMGATDLSVPIDLSVAMDLSTPLFDLSPGPDLSVPDLSPLPDLSPVDLRVPLDLTPVDLRPIFDLRPVDLTPVLDLRPVDLRPIFDLTPVDLTVPHDLSSFDLTTPPDAPPGTLLVDVRLYASTDMAIDSEFTPSTIFIFQGQSVAWRYVDANPHSVTSCTGSPSCGVNGIFCSNQPAVPNPVSCSLAPPFQAQPFIYIHQFDDLGTFAYKCLNHGYGGTVVVMPIA